MRKLTAYEAKKWGLGYEFRSPEWLRYGDESGEYYDAFVAAYRPALAMSNGDLAAALQIQILDMYYADVEWMLSERFYEDEVILPEWNVFEAKLREIRMELVGPSDLVNDNALMEALDWAVEWNEKYGEEVRTQRYAQKLRAELERIEKRNN